MHDRTPQGRFSAGNRHGIHTRFRLGSSGNPRGRPPRVMAFLNRLCSRSAAELRAIAMDESQTRRARIAARYLLVATIISQPIAGVDPLYAKRLRYRLASKTNDQLAVILLNETERPERREAARQRLLPWPY